jgi:hypothetical protein
MHGRRYVSCCNVEGIASRDDIPVAGLITNQRAQGSGLKRYKDEEAMATWRGEMRGEGRTPHGATRGSEVATWMAVGDGEAWVRGTVDEQRAGRPCIA